MEPLLTSLLQAAAAFGTAAVGKVAECAVGDAWDALKNAIARKRPDVHEAPKLLEDLRGNSQGPDAARIVQRLGELGITRDPEIAGALRELVTALQSEGGSITVNNNSPTAQTVNGNQIAIGPATFNFGKVD